MVSLSSRKLGFRMELREAKEKSTMAMVLPSTLLGSRLLPSGLSSELKKLGPKP